MGEGSSFSLVKFEGQPFEKLIEVIGQGIGTLYRPTAIRKEAKAKAFEIEVIEKAKAIANAESKLVEFETYSLIEQKILYQQLKKQNNTDQIVNVAIEQIEQESEVSSEKVDPDWTTRFFNIAEDISNDEMQKLWGRILAGEVKQPGSFSLRTLELLKNLSKDEAESFNKFSNLALSYKSTYFVLNTDNGRLLKDDFDITFEQTLLLSELGLISSKDNLEFSLTASNKDTISVIQYGNKGILLKRPANTTTQKMSVLVFSRIGTELLKLINPVINQKYIDSFCRNLIYPTVKISYGDLIKLENGTIGLENEIEFVENDTKLDF